MIFINYILLVKDDNTLCATRKAAIMQYSNLVDTLCFLCPQKYGDEDMTAYDSVLLEYITPTSKKYKTDILNRAAELYKDCIQYTLPVNTGLTMESGDIELQLSFIRNETNTETGAITTHVRKISPYILKVFPISNWSQFIPDDALTVLDQKIAQLKALQEEIENIQSSILEGAIDDDNVSSKTTWSSDKINGIVQYYDARLDNIGAIG